MEIDKAKKLLQMIQQFGDADAKTLFLSSGGGMSAATAAMMFEIIFEQLAELKQIMGKPLDMSWIECRQPKPLEGSEDE